MDRLWAPWRINYIKKAIKGSNLNKKKACIFCKNFKEGSHVIFKTRHSISILNIFPYNNGHVMIAPKKHLQDLSQLNEEEVLDLFKAMTDTKKLLDICLKPEGYNIGINLGRSAGAGIAGHLHIHIVPRWHGDTNFMPILYNTKVVSQSLHELHRRLRSALKEMR